MFLDADILTFRFTALSTLVKAVRANDIQDSYPFREGDVFLVRGGFYLQ